MIDELSAATPARPLGGGRRPKCWDQQSPPARRLNRIKVCGLRVFVRLLRVFVLLAERFQMVPLRSPSSHGKSDVTLQASGRGPLTSARAGRWSAKVW